MTSTRAPANVARCGTELAPQLGPGPDVEGGERLVEQQQPGLGDERAGQGDALLLTTGERAGLALGDGQPRPTRSSHSPARRRASAARIPRLRSPNATFSSTLRCGNSR